ncbi:hypothetical protein [Actinomadura harenae]|uniref:Uncharacterized protein n=1 Tax=Actinomadura harenae TaxID=2483351 RepID=A0A3M2LQ06_9ACTN|nr:hypothetical protein [Actinomadura harenae]RMI38623.1 hypothetical protein EBO15_32335 [Actinomadura harenae]
MRWLRFGASWLHRQAAGPDLGWMFDEDAAPDSPAYTRRVHETLANSPITAGWVLNAEPEQVEGYMGVSLWVPMLGVGGHVTGRRIWIEASAVQDLLDIADHIRTPAFRAAMGAHGRAYT